MNLKPNVPKERKKKETTSDPIRPEEPVTRSFTTVIYAGDGKGKGRGFLALLCAVSAGSLSYAGLRECVPK
jgi:hypothetical protein